MGCENEVWSPYRSPVRRCRRSSRRYCRIYAVEERSCRHHSASPSSDRIPSCVRVSSVGLSAHMHTHTGTFKGNSQQRERGIERPEIKLKIRSQQDVMHFYLPSISYECDHNATVSDATRKPKGGYQSASKITQTSDRMLCKNAFDRVPQIFHPWLFLLSLRRLVDRLRKNIKFREGEKYSEARLRHFHQTPSSAEHTSSCVNAATRINAYIQRIYICRLPYNARFAARTGESTVDDHRESSVRGFAGQYVSGVFRPFRTQEVR